MAPNGGPSMTSQARAAELNAAAAARARILTGDLSDFNKPRSSQPVALAHSTQTEQVTVESFKRPNRPVDRYYPSLATTPGVPVYAYQQSQYIDPHAMPTVFIPTHYPVAAEYYQPVFQPMQGYQQMYPSYMGGYAPVSPLRHGAPTRHNVPRSTPSPKKSGPSQFVQRPTTPAAKPPRFPSPAGNTWRGRSKSPPKSPVKKIKATPSPKKPPPQVPRFFTPDDLSPLKVEVDIMRFKAAQEKLAEEEAANGPEDNTSPEKSPAKSNDGHEDDIGHHKGEDPAVEEDEQLTPRANQPTPVNTVQASVPTNQSFTKAQPEADPQPPALENSLLAQKAYRKTIAEMLRPSSFLPPGLMLQAEAEDHFSGGNQQASLEETRNKTTSKATHEDDGIFQGVRKTSEVDGEITPKAIPRRLQSPFQPRPRSPVAYYQPIVNKYSRSVFESRRLLLEELLSLYGKNSWMAVRQKPELKDVPGPFKGFPRFPLLDENGHQIMSTGSVKAPPGFAHPGQIALSHSTHWNPESGSSNRGATYYDRVLASEDWFHQSILNRKENSNELKKNITQIASAILSDNKPSVALAPSKDIQRAQVTEMVKRISENLLSYTHAAETEKRGLDFRHNRFELDPKTGLQRRRRHHLTGRKSHRERKRAVEFYVAPGFEVFDGAAFSGRHASST